MHNYAMYIIAIGWLYVTVLVALNEPSVVAGIASFLFYGLLPCGLLLWLGGGIAIWTDSQKKPAHSFPLHVTRRGVEYGYM